MQIFRPLTLSLLVALSSQFTPLSAQSASRSPETSSPFAAVSPNVPNNFDLFQLLSPLDMRSMSLSPEILAGEKKNDSPELISKEEAVRQTLELEANQSACLTLRTYRVVRESPGSDSTRPAGYTTCVPSARFKLKTAVETQVISPE